MFLRRNFLQSIGSIFSINLFDKPKENLVKQTNNIYFVEFKDHVYALSNNKQYADDFALLWNFDRIMRLLHYSHKEKSEYIADDILMSPEYFINILIKYCNIKEVSYRDSYYLNNKKSCYHLDRYLSFDEVKQVMEQVKCDLPFKVVTETNNSGKVECIILNNMDDVVI